MTDRAWLLKEGYLIGAGTAYDLTTGRMVTTVRAIKQGREIHGMTLAEIREKAAAVPLSDVEVVTHG